MRPGTRRILGAVALVACLGASVALPTEKTEAAWTDAEVDTATLTSGVMNPVTTFSCQAASGFLDPTVGFTWGQPIITGNGLTPTAYEMEWTGIGSGTTGPIVGLSGDISVGLLAIGTFTVRIRAIKGTWTSAWSTQSRSVTVITSLLWNCS